MRLWEEGKKGRADKRNKGGMKGDGERGNRNIKRKGEKEKEEIY